MQNPPESTLVLAGHSVRALAQSAHASGIRTVAVDHYSDLDTCEAAWRAIRVNGASGESPEQLLLGPLGKPFESAMLVAGAGFEGKRASLAALSRRFRVMGNPPEVWGIVDRPEVFADLLEDLGIPYPETRTSPPDRLDGWLFKARSTCGGMGIYPAAEKRTDGSGCYRRYVAGKPASVLFVADGHRAHILGYHHLLLSRLPGRPYVYAGAVEMENVPKLLTARIGHWVAALTARLELRGLNGVDFMIHAGEPCFLELNPRPTATVELHEPRMRGGGLITHHLRGCMGELPERLPANSPVRGLRVLFAKREFRTPSMQWPNWSGDRPPAGALVGEGEPICSITGAGGSSLEARRVLASRSKRLRAMLSAHEPGVAGHGLEA